MRPLSTVAIAGILGGCALTGCGAPHASLVSGASSISSPSPSSIAATTNPPAPSSKGPSLPSAASQASHTPFPKIVRQAMRSVPMGLVQTPEAPTRIPYDQSGPTRSVRSTLFRGPVPGYTIRLSAAHHPLASFGAMQYGSAHHAADAARLNPYAQGPGGIVVGYEKLSAGLTGTVKRYNGQASSAMANQPWASVSWQVGRWLIEVTNYGNTRVPSLAAKHVAAALARDDLPKPQIQGAMFVSLHPTAGSNNPSMEVNLQWEKGPMEYLVDANHTAVKPVSTAIQMAISMTPYSNGSS